jgi:hypothetical protein
LGAGHEEHPFQRGHARFTSPLEIQPSADSSTSAMGRGKNDSMNAGRVAALHKVNFFREMTLQGLAGFSAMM